MTRQELAMPTLLSAITARLDRSGVSDRQFPDGKGEYWAHCPFHDDANATNFSVSERGYKCLACDASGGLRELAKHLGIEVRERQRAGITLAEYADAKRLPVGFLRGLGLDDGRINGRPIVLIPYKDQSGRTVSVRRRLRLQKPKRGKDLRFMWRKGDSVLPYGLWRLAQMREAGWMLLVEGESDSHTAWLYDVPALGIPGAATWKSEWAAHLQGIEVYVWREPDQGGDTFIQRLQRDLPSAKVIVPPSGLKDLSDVLCAGHSVPDEIERLKKLAKPIASIQPISQSAQSLGEIAPWVHGELNERNNRETKLKVANVICAWFTGHDKLIVDEAQDLPKGGRPYLVNDYNALWPLEKQAVQTRITMYEAGLNGTEDVYSFVLEALTMETYRGGRRTRLAHWQTHKDDALYVSCGPCRLVRARGNELEKLANGADGVWFAGDACYPEWELAEPIGPMDAELSAFHPNLIAPQEVPEYTPDIQRELLAVWMAALLSGMRPLPIMALIGQKGGGKSMLAKAILRMLMGPSGSPTALSDDKRDFWTSATTSPFLGLDNVDSDAPKWFPDALAAAATGVTIETRQLYTDSQRLARPVTAALAITTRTATFARPDVAERSLPLTTDEFDDANRQGDTDLLDAVDLYRDRLLSWCAQMASALITDHHYAPAGLPLRFVDFARLAWAYLRQEGREGEAATILRALRRAQALTVGEADPLVEAVAMFFPAMAVHGEWRGTPSELPKALTEAGASLPYLGGGKAIANKLREARATLALLGIAMMEETQGNNRYFILRDANSQPGLDMGDQDEYGDDEQLPF
jgi:hypothetical protein